MEYFLKFYSWTLVSQHEYCYKLKLYRFTLNGKTSRKINSLNKNTYVKNVEDRMTDGHRDDTILNIVITVPFSKRNFTNYNSIFY